MDEQQFQAYVALIEQLLACPQGGEMELLQAQAELVDEGLLAVMQQYADLLEQQGGSNAGRLRQIAQELKAAMEYTEAQNNDSLDVSEKFLRAIFQLIISSEGDAQQVYSFLSQHKNQLNETLL